MRCFFNLPLSHDEARRIAKSIILPPYSIADRERTRGLFDHGYIPGTFILSERKANPAFLLGERHIGYENWLKTVVQSHLTQLQQAQLQDRSLGVEEINLLARGVLAILETPVRQGEALCDRITNQQVTDITWRAVKCLLTGDAFADLHPLREFNSAGASFALRLVRRSKTVDSHLLFKRAVIAGIIGCERKARYIAAGPSPVSVDTSISLPEEGDEESLQLAERQLSERISASFQIAQDSEFQREVLEAAGGLLLVFFLDDLVETVFDLWAIQRWLQQNVRLRVTIVPRLGQHANDASFADVMSLLRDPLFSRLSNEIGNRAIVLESGPAGSGLDPFEFSKELVDQLYLCDVVAFKGARAYEMMQGIRRVAYYGFNVQRTYTESLTGLSAHTRPAVIIRQPPGVPTFREFRARAWRRLQVDSSTEIAVAAVTASEFVGCDLGGCRSISDLSKHDQPNHADKEGSS